jgi:hypothetical protein
MLFIESSPVTVVGETTSDPITVFTQFYIPADPERYNEIKFCLAQNVKNHVIGCVVLLNERLYTAAELGVSSEKVVQVVIGRRLLFSDFFERMREGYNVLANADIFFDTTLMNVRHSDIHSARKMYALLRYEFRGTALDECKLFMYNGRPRPDSADTFILHSSHKVPLKAFKFHLGAPGCDNKVCYLFSMLGYTVYNDPEFIKTYHYHTEQGRNYTLAVVPSPYMNVIPARQHGVYPSIYTFDHPNKALMAYIQDRRSRKSPFIIPRIAGIENNTAFLAYHKQELPPGLQRAMKNNAGINLPTPKSFSRYSKWYLKAFEACDLYASWEPFGHYINHIKDSHAFIQDKYKKPQIWAYGFDIFHYIYRPWTQALRGMKILLISPFVDLMRDTTVYGVDLFPECTFVYLKPPQTQGLEPSREWHDEFQDFCEKVKEVEFDVALCSCGGYGNPLCAYIHSLGKSAIYVGGVLQMYFGIYGNRWLTERKDVLSIYMTPQWTRPTERPRGFENIEKSCYW